ncbi:hypothetical protein [Streptomyces triticisoli]|uniref:hypothetical protein n=1 Tax=Streptomyces triticisoli TaxID=2182797 RepID=UPI000DDA57F4|nr:hypothetical protein [Streptomyces triticisoli]
MGEIAGRTGHRGRATAVVNESYSFACMRCGHGWEQSYEIEHHTDGDGKEFVMYVADGRVVPSPLSRPNCGNCDGHVVRIMRAGRVSSAQSRQSGQSRQSRPRRRPPAPADRPEHHHWHLSDLLHPFHRRTG